MPLWWIVELAVGELKRCIDKVFRMEERAKAHEHMEANSVRGS